jgi:translation initiation factor eIF-2B subunit delta
LTKSTLLDAYTDAPASSRPSAFKDDDRPVTKKNKNQKKREAEKLRKKSESENKPESPEEEIIDSWEDLESNADDGTQLPRTIEFPAIPNVTEVVEKLETLTIVENPAKLKLEQLEKTLKAMNELFVAKPLVKMSDGKNVVVEKSDKRKAEPQPVTESADETKKESKEKTKETASANKGETVPTSDSKSPEEIKADREAKKKAKAEAKGKAKNKDNSTEPPPKSKSEPAQQSESKSPEEIKAEREAKKNAKAEAKGKAKNKDDATEPPPKSKSEPAQQSEQNEMEGKSKAQLKAERRAKQEAQRAAKADEAQKKEDSKSKPQQVKRVPDEIQADRASVEKKLAKRLASQQILPRTKAQRKVQLFSHLHQYEREFSISSSYPIVGSHIHPSIMTLGLQFAEGNVVGSNARCVALMKALKDFIEDYTTPESSELDRDLNDKLKPQITFLKECRPNSISMGNAIRSLKSRINAVPSGSTEKEAKGQLIKWMDEYVYHNVVLAAEQIAITACEKICDGDVILTYGCSSLLSKVFAKASDEGRKFRVVVADGRPKFEGKEMVRRIVNMGVHCTYVLASSVPYIIQEVSKVFLGAHAVMTNGCVMSRVGTSQMALVAKSHNIPVLVCCETYKFTERVQTDSFVFNELGDPDDLVDTGLNVNPLEDWRDLSSLTMLNLAYDVTPANLVDAIISEISVIPGTSVPVVLRLKHDQTN